MKIFALQINEVVPLQMGCRILDMAIDAHNKKDYGTLYFPKHKKWVVVTFSVTIHEG